MDDFKPTLKRQDYILIVEDEVQMQDVMKDLLESNGYNVLVANDAFEAMELYQQKGTLISLVILDVMLPEMDGRELYYELKKIDEDLKAFFCSGFTSLVEIQSMIEKENLFAIQKPFSPKEFLAVVQEVLNEEPGVR